MLTLYKYIHESLLDDEEDLLDNDDDFISHELNKLNKSTIRNIDKDIPIVVPDETGRPKDNFIKVYNNNLLILNDSPCYIHQPIIKYKKYFDSVIAAGIHYDGNIKDNFIKNFITSRFFCGDRFDMDDINLSDVNIRIEEWPSIISKYYDQNVQKSFLGRKKQFNLVNPVNFVGPSCKLNNCNIYFGNTVTGNTIEFSSLQSFPEFNNCKFEGCHQINIMGLPIFFKNKNVLSTLDKVFKKCEYPYGDSRDGLFKKVNGFKDIISIIKNPKKYHYVSRGPEAKPRMSIDNFINEESNLSDAFPWVNDFKSLNTIYIISNKVKIKFMKKTLSFSTQRLCTKDGWCVSLEYYKY